MARSSAQAGQQHRYGTSGSAQRWREGRRVKIRRAPRREKSKNPLGVVFTVDMFLLYTRGCLSRHKESPQGRSDLSRFAIIEPTLPWASTVVRGCFHAQRRRWYRYKRRKKCRACDRLLGRAKKNSSTKCTYLPGGVLKGRGVKRKREKNIPRRRAGSSSKLIK